MSHQLHGCFGRSGPCKPSAAPHLTGPLGVPASTGSPGQALVRPRALGCIFRSASSSAPAVP